jgi:putative PIN family toxin of toxin-antitoxin system
VRVVFDSNVLISARLAPLGAPARLLRAWTEERFELVVSPQLLSEIAGVLARDRFRRWMTEEEADAFVATLRAAATVVENPPAEAGLTPDPDDDFLVALARSASADYVVSGDRDLTGLADPDPPILTPRAFLELVS